MVWVAKAIGAPEVSSSGMNDCKPYDMGTASWATHMMDCLVQQLKSGVCFTYRYWFPTSEIEFLLTGNNKPCIRAMLKRRAIGQIQQKSSSCMRSS